MTVTQAEIDKVVAESKRVLIGNHHSGISAWDGKLYECTYPSPTSYPFQWFWDSAFISIALLHVDPALAKREITCLLQGVQPDGFMPHMLLWEKSSYLHWLEDEYSIRLAHPFYTGTTQPPVVARAIERIYDATKDVAFLRETLDGLDPRVFRREAVQALLDEHVERRRDNRRELWALMVLQLWIDSCAARWECGSTHVARTPALAAVAAR